MLLKMISVSMLVAVSVAIVGLGSVIVIKRSLSPGFAGIPNPLFANDNTLMFFNDAKKAFAELIAAVKES